MLPLALHSKLIEFTIAFALVLLLARLHRR
jgi:hypothetical protein